MVSLQVQVMVNFDHGSLLMLNNIDPFWASLGQFFDLLSQMFFGNELSSLGAGHHFFNEILQEDSGSLLILSNRLNQSIDFNMFFDFPLCLLLFRNSVLVFLGFLLQLILHSDCIKS
jgi:hypothetical protein